MPTLTAVIHNFKLHTLDARNLALHRSNKPVPGCHGCLTIPVKCCECGLTETESPTTTFWKVGADRGKAEYECDNCSDNRLNAK